MKKIFLFLILILSSCIKITVTSSDVANKITRLNREIPQVKADLALEKQLKRNIEVGKKTFLYSNNYRDFGSYDLHVIEGRVLLTGIVHNEEARRYIIGKITENVKVRELLDELVVSRENRKNVSDFFIRRLIKTKIFLISKIRSLNYEISVVNGYAYIIGIASGDEELEFIAKSISTVRGVKEVVSYTITVDSAKKIKLEYL